MENKIGILGSGVVAQTLGDGFLKKGFRVMLGTRDTNKLSDWLIEHEGKAQAGSFGEAAEFGDMLVLAVKGSAAQKVLEMAGSKNIEGKLIMDATNPIANTPPEEGVLSFFTDLNESLMEKLQKAQPEAHFVKVFNSVGNALMVDPPLEPKPTMFICGNHQKSKEMVKEILETFGWEYEDMGSAKAARAIEPLCILWCIPGFRENRWTHAFKILNA